MKAIREWIKEPRSILDLHTYGGLLLMGLGAAAVYIPAGPIVVGAGLFYLAARRG